MRRLTVVGAATVLAGLLPVGPAHADATPGVVYSREVRAVPLDYGYLVEVVCNASADPGTTQHVPVATAVSCSLGGLTQTRALVGPESYVTNASATTGPIVFCIWGEAAFVDSLTGVILTAEGTPQCETMTFSGLYSVISGG